MTAQFSSTYDSREKSPRQHAPSRLKEAPVVLGFRTTDRGWWQRSRPHQPGVYPVVSRDGGMWLGETRHTSEDWRGWWCSVTVEVTRALKRPLPPAPEWE